MQQTLSTLYYILRDNFDYELELIPEHYTPLQINSKGIVDLNPSVPKIDVLRVLRDGKVYVEIYCLTPYCVSLNAAGFPSKSGYDKFFVEMVGICSANHFPICTTPHHLTEANRLARTKATLKAHDVGYDIDYVRTNSAQLIGFLPKLLRNSYNGDLKYIGSPEATHIQLSVKGIRALKVMACIIDMLPTWLKAKALRKAHKSLAEHMSCPVK